MPFSKNITPLRLAGIYALFGALSIVLSNELLKTFISPTSPQYIPFQNIKGWLFVLASAGLIYLISKHDDDSRRRENARTAYQARLIEDVSDALISSDMQFKVVIWNSAAEKIYQWKASEVIGNRLERVLQTKYENEGSSAQAYQELTETGHWGGEVIQVRKDGTRFPVLASVSFVTDEQGVRVGLVGVNRDISERKQAEMELLHSEQRFRLLIENGLDNISMLAADGTLLWESPARMRTLGYPANTFRGRNIFELVHADDLSWVAAQFADLLSHPNATSRGKFRVQHSNGTWRWIESIGTNLLDVPGVNAIVINYRDVTEKKLAEEALYFSQQQLLSMIREAPLTIAMFDLAMRYVAVSERWVEVYGRGQTDLIGKSHYEINPDLPERWREAHQRGLSGETLRNDDDLWIQADGSKKWLRWAIVPWHDGKGRIEGIIISAEDITERRQAEVALSQSEQNYRNLLEHASDGIFIFNNEGQHILVNEVACALMGYSREELLSMHVVDLIDAEDLQIQPLRMEEIRRGGTIRIERIFVRKNGKRIYCEVSAKMLPDGRFQSLVRDITSRKRTERREKQKTQTLELLAKGASLSIVLKAIVAIVENDLEDSMCSILLLDASKKYLLLGAAPHLPDFYNKAIQEVQIGEGQGSCGTSAYTGQRVVVEDIETHPYWENYREVAREAGVRSCWSEPILSSNAEILGTFAVYHAQACVPSSEELECIVNLTSLASIAIEGKRAEQTIREYAEDLEQRVEQRTAELMRANRTKDEFLANMSHELRTPLNSVLGFSETLLEGVRGPLDPRQEEAVQLIHASGKHLLALISDILDVSKIEFGKFEIRPEVVSVNDICRSSLNFIKQLANTKSISVEYIPLTDTSTSMLVDARRLKQILINLLNNAVKFTSEMGKVTLEVLADAEREQIQFIVEDTGIGIAEDDLHKLFKPFVQLDSSLSRQYEGSGLGLMMVEKLVHMHGGSVQVHSDAGKGSRFTVIFPWKQKIDPVEGELLFTEEAREGPLSSNRLPAPGNDARILLAEDNETNVMVIKDYLENHGYQVFVAHNGSEAIVKANEIFPQLILMDIQMPQMNGLEATRRLRATPGFATVPIIALTAFAMPGDRERCLEAGTNEFLTKPVHLRKLHEMISVLLN